VVDFIVTTWARVICLKYMPKSEGADFGHTFQANHECPCYSYYITVPKANSLNANTSTPTGFFVYAHLKGPIMVMQQIML